MGTNYYTSTGDACPCCGRGDDELHIGKSSAGWVFALCVYPDEGLNTLDDWMTYLEGRRIWDEYGEVLTAEDMKRVIAERSRGKGFDEKPYGYDDWETFHRMNHSEFGPNNLLRSRLSSRVIGHGEGTWDYHKPGFS